MTVSALTVGKRSNLASWKSVAVAWAPRGCAGHAPDWRKDGLWTRWISRCLLSSRWRSATSWRAAWACRWMISLPVTGGMGVMASARRRRASFPWRTSPPWTRSFSLHALCRRPCSCTIQVARSVAPLTARWLAWATRFRSSMCVARTASRVPWRSGPACAMNRRSGVPACGEVLRQGRAVWSASHYAITTRTVTDALRQARGEAP